MGPLKTIRLPESLFDWSKLDRRTQTHRVVCFLCLFITEVIGGIYRNYVWGHDFTDFGLADAWANIWAVPTMVFFDLGFFRRPAKMPSTISGVVVGLIIYELLQTTKLLGAVFDWKDVIGTALGAPIALVLYNGTEGWLSRRAAVEASNSGPVEPPST